MTDYWFARRFPVGQMSNSLSPVSDKGWAVVRTFLAFMISGALSAILLAVVGILWVPFLWVAAPVVYIACAAYGGWYFITMATRHGDKTHTVADYQSGNVQPMPTGKPGDRPGRTPSISAHFHAESDGYWFARYRTGPNPGRGLVPVSWQGYAVIAGFVLSLILGGLIFLLTALISRQFFFGIATFVVFAIVGASVFLWAATTKSDPNRTVADYQSNGGLR